jgi:GTP-binding protein
VVLYVDPQVRDLQLFTYKVHFKAGFGQGGMGAKKHGANGATVRIPVPKGTQVWVVEASEGDSDRLARSEEQVGEARPIADLVHKGQELVVARGGAGGRGNTRFKNSVHQAPKFSELGEAGETYWLRLSLKLMADAGLAGLPNAGKSSLLKRLSNAKPKVADYPFTTVEPMLGVVDWSGDGEVFTLADVPGLLEGASDGVGLGHEFLAHLERCFLLLHVVDITGSSGIEPLDGFRVILRELDAHARGLAEKPQLVVLNKIDAVTPEQVEEQRDIFASEIELLRRQGHPAFTYMVGEDEPLARQMVWPVSASTGMGLKGLAHWLGPLLRELGAGGEVRGETETIWTPVLGDAEALEEPGATEGLAARPQVPRDESEQESLAGGHMMYRPVGTSERSFVVRRVKKGFVVEGEGVRRLVRRFDLDNEEAIRYVAEKFERLGVYAALRAQGAQPGDDVDVEGFAFEFN